MKTKKPTEDYIWIAHLDDGSAFREYAGGEARGWKSVPHERVISLELKPQRLGLSDVRIPIRPHQRPILFRRRQLRIHLSTDGHVEPRGTITVIGWESDTEAHFWAAYPDGRVEEHERSEDIQ